MFYEPDFFIFQIFHIVFIRKVQNSQSQRYDGLPKIFVTEIISNTFNHTTKAKIARLTFIEPIASIAGEANKLMLIVSGVESLLVQKL